MQARLDRKHAARWVSVQTGQPVEAGHLYFWEQRGLLRKKNPGHRIPAWYRLEDLVRLRLVVELRREGAPLARVGKAARQLAGLLPDPPDALAVLATGDLVPVTDEMDLLEVARESRWLYLLDAREYVTAAKRALEVEE